METPRLICKTFIGEIPFLPSEEDTFIGLVNGMVNVYRFQYSDGTYFFRVNGKSKTYLGFTTTSQDKADELRNEFLEENVLTDVQWFLDRGFYHD